MTSDAGSRRRTHLALLLEGGTGYWLAVFALASPWLRIPLGPWVLYPGTVALSLLLAAVLLDEGGWVGAVRPLAPLLALGGWVALVAALQGQWTAALLAAGTTAANFVWGAAALRLGLGGRTSAPRAALVLLLAATLAVGLVLWGVQALWPAGCRALNCSERTFWPYAFTGGWGSAAQYALLLVFLLAPVGGLLVAALAKPGGGLRRWALPGLGAGAGLALVAGAPLWALLLVAAGWLFLRRRLSPATRDPQRLMLRGLAAGALFAVLVVYGLEPGYVNWLWGDENALPPVRVSLAGPPPRGLTSEQATQVPILVRNAGWSRLGSTGSPLRLGLRFLLTPERGPARVLDGPQVRLPGPLAPGATRTLEVAVRIPPWVKGGYLTWRVTLGGGMLVPLAHHSAPGFRFANLTYHRLELDHDNLLSALAERARAYESETHAPPVATPVMDSAGMIAGDVLDTLFFSPLWGEPEPSGQALPFSSHRPLLPSLLHQYGLVGLGLALWVLWRLLRRAAICAERNDPGWLLLPLALVLLVGAGVFTPALGSYHSDWALFLLAGFLEGRTARKFPGLALRGAPRWVWRLPLWPSRRMGAPRRRLAGRGHRR